MPEQIQIQTSNFSEIERQWQSYRHQVIPIRTGPQQIEEMKAAFFAGALCALDLLAVKGAMTDALAPKTCRALASLASEIRAFGGKRVSGAPPGSSLPAR
jgi:hypothetical protein